MFYHIDFTCISSIKTLLMRCPTAPPFELNNSSSFGVYLSSWELNVDSRGIVLHLRNSSFIWKTGNGGNITGEYQLFWQLSYLRINISWFQLHNLQSILNYYNNFKRREYLQITAQNDTKYPFIQRFILKWLVWLYFHLCPLILSAMFFCSH